MNEGHDTSANKPHLFNWLYDMTVQMTQAVCVYICVQSPQCCHIFTHSCVCVCVCVCVGEKGGGIGYVYMHPMHVPAISFLTSLLCGHKPALRYRSLIRKKALLLLAKM